MMPEGVNETAHAIRSKFRPLHVCGERSAVAELPRPLKHLLAVALDPRRGPRDGNRHLIPRRRKLLHLRRSPQPPNHIGKVRVRAGKIDRALRLDVEKCVRPIGALIASIVTSSRGRSCADCWNRTARAVAPGSPRGSPEPRRARR
jgi:hypothetical protein